MIFSGFSWVFLMVYVDDVMIFSETFEEHLRHLEQTFRRIIAFRGVLKPSKCRILRTSVDFVGHVVSANGISAQQRKIDTVVNWPIPATVNELQRFLGLCSYYRKFIQDYAQVAAPLHELLASGVPKDLASVWGQRQMEAFNELKHRLSNPPILRYPDYNRRFRLVTDASDIAISANLTQVYDGKDHVIAYASRSLSPTERKYSVSERECLAAVWGITKHRSYLTGVPFDVVTDHRALLWLYKCDPQYGRLARWSLFLAEFDYTVIHRPGKANIIADGPSRIPDQPVGEPFDDYPRQGELPDHVMQSIAVHQCAAFLLRSGRQYQPAIPAVQPEDPGSTADDAVLQRLPQLELPKKWTIDAFCDAQRRDPRLQKVLSKLRLSPSSNQPAPLDQ